MSFLDFTPHRERARHAALVERARRATPARPFVLLCPREALATAIEARVARAGGAAMRVLGWDTLCDTLEDALDLPPVAPAVETARVAIVEAALARTAHDDGGLSRALEVDAYGVALAALTVIDELRMAAWSGSEQVVDLAAPSDATGAAGLVRRHVVSLAEWTRALEDGMRDAAVLDLPGRLARIARTSGAARGAFEELFTEGMDRIRPLERAVLDRLADAGVRVDVAPWVLGWRGKSARPVEPTTLPRTALEAFGRSIGETAPGDDESILELSARDPDDEADAVAHWVAARSEDERARLAILVPHEPGYPARVLRALERHGLVGAYACTEPVRSAPIWQVVRASVRLAWLGPDAIELATVLSAPGGGIWGADRDRLCARLRERVPTTWAAVREILHDATDPARLIATETSPGTAQAGAAIPDPERVRQLQTARERVEELVALWETAGPLSRRPVGQRVDALAVVVRATLARFVNPMRFREAFDSGRVAAAWVTAAGAVRTAFETVLTRLERTRPALPPNDPSFVLAPVEALLGDGPDAQNRRRDDAIRVLVDSPFVTERPEVLIVLGFQRGRYPAPAVRPLLLGPLEIEALQRASSAVPGLAELPDDGTRAALAGRDARRALCLPTRQLILIAPRRDAAGERLEPSLSRRDLLAAYPTDVATARARRGPRSAQAFVASTTMPPSPRASLEIAAGRLGSGDARGALDALTLRGSVLPDGARELVAARFRPERDFTLGPLVRARLHGAELSPRALETLLKCRYAFLSASLLRLRELPLRRAPALSPRDHVVLALDTLQRLEGSPADPAAIDAALSASVSARLPWAERELGGMSLQEMRRTVRAFVDRYLAARTQWGLAGALAGPEPLPGDEGPRAVTVPIDTRGEQAPRELSVVGEPALVERVGGGENEAVLLEVRLGRVNGIAAQREAGLDVATALMPIVTERRLGVPVGAVATVSLGRAEAEVIARPGRGARFANAEGQGTEVVARVEDLDAHRDGVLARIAAAVDDISGEAGEFRPHTREERARLLEAGATSCEYCPARLGCRFEEGGGS